MFLMTFKMMLLIDNDDDDSDDDDDDDDDDNNNDIDCNDYNMLAVIMMIIFDDNYR